MLSSTILAIATSLFSFSASAVPLQIRSEGVNEYSSPQINGNSSTGITWATYTGSGWQWISSGEGASEGYPADTVIMSQYSLFSPLLHCQQDTDEVAPSA